MQTNPMMLCKTQSFSIFKAALRHLSVVNVVYIHLLKLPQIFHFKVMPHPKMKYNDIWKHIFLCIQPFIEMYTGLEQLWVSNS